MSWKSIHGINLQRFRTFADNQLHAIRKHRHQLFHSHQIRDSLKWMRFSSLTATIFVTMLQYDLSHELQFRFINTVFSHLASPNSVSLFVDLSKDLWKRETKCLITSFKELVLLIEKTCVCILSLVSYENIEYQIKWIKDCFFLCFRWKMNSSRYVP